jgi:hypothetical protein
MSDVRVDESPNHFMALDAISRGIKSAGKTAKVTRLDMPVAELVVNDLIAQRLVLRTEKKGFFGNKKTELAVSHTGSQLLNTKKRELERKFQELQQWYSNGQTQQLQNSMQNDRMWIPFMLFSGIMNAMFFMSMMSFMGAAMTPAESALAGGGGGSSSNDASASDASAAAVGDNHSSASEAGAGTDVGGDFGGDIGAGDFSF